MRRWVRVARSVPLIVVSCIAGVLCVEVAWRLIGAGAAKDDGRYALFAQAGGGPVFRNGDGFFTYQPGATISTATYYATGTGWVREFGYSYRTNDFGLVQSADVRPGVAALLVLGDSFTEGQGAPPWFDGFAAGRSGGAFQTINGGLLGTGFRQWQRLHDHLVASGLDVARLLVVFVSDDYARAPWTVHPDILRCIGDFRACQGRERFYGMPPDTDLARFLEDMRKARSTGGGSPPASTSGSLLASAFPALTRIGQFVADRLGISPKSAAAVDSDRTIRSFIGTYGARVLFVHIPERGEVERGVSPAGAAVREQIRQSGGQLYDGFARCGLARADYHAHDRHPNAQGYAKIARCVADAVRALAD